MNANDTKTETPKTLRPLGDRVLVRRKKPDERTAGGIIIPDASKERPNEGVVVAVGPGKMTQDGQMHEVDVEKGDHVLFGKWQGTEVRLEGEDLVIVREDDIFGVLEG